MLKSLAFILVLAWIICIKYSFVTTSLVHLLLIIAAILIILHYIKNADIRED